MKKNIEMLTRVCYLIEPVFKILEIKAVIDLQEEADGEADQLCIGDYIICADEKTGSFDVIEPLDDDGKEVAVMCFPGAIHVARYIVSKFI